MSDTTIKMCSDCAHKFDWMVDGEWSRCAMRPDRPLIRARAECLGKAFEAKAETLTAVPPEAAACDLDVMRERLVRAAGDMLAALQEALPYMEEAEKAGLVGDEGCHWPVEMVRAAIAKARGED